VELPDGSVVRLRVSRDAVFEYRARIEDMIVENLSLIAERVFRSGRRTILERDVVGFFDVVGRRVV